MTNHVVVLAGYKRRVDEALTQHCPEDQDDPDSKWQAVTGEIVNYVCICDVFKCLKILLHVVSRISCPSWLVVYGSEKRRQFTSHHRLTRLTLSKQVFFSLPRERTSALYISTVTHLIQIIRSKIQCQISKIFKRIEKQWTDIYKVLLRSWNKSLLWVGWFL